MISWLGMLVIISMLLCMWTVRLGIRVANLASVIVLSILGGFEMLLCSPNRFERLFLGLVTVAAKVLTVLRSWTVMLMLMLQVKLLGLLRMKLLLSASLFLGWSCMALCIVFCLFLRAVLSVRLL